MVNIHDVAKKAGVSTATVSHVVNKTRKVNPDTLERVELAIKELDYQPNEQARSLKTGRSHLIGVLNYHSADEYFAEVISSLEAAASAAGYDVMLRHSDRDGENQGTAISAWTNKNIDGLIINSPYITDDFREQLTKLNCPCVFLHINDQACKCDTISVTDLEVSKEAIQHLIKLGHKRIACIAGFSLNYHTVFDRRKGYEKAMREAGLPIRKEYFVVTDYGIQEGYQQFMDLMKLSNPPTAIFTYSDMLAIGAIRAAADMGFSVPEDVSIIGFDDIKLASYSTPRLTTIFQDKQQIGELAVNQIMKRIENPGLPQEQLILKAHLIIRESTGPVKR